MRTPKVSPEMEIRLLEVAHGREITEKNGTIRTLQEENKTLKQELVKFKQLSYLSSLSGLLNLKFVQEDAEIRDGITFLVRSQVTSLSKLIEIS